MTKIDIIQNVYEKLGFSKKNRRILLNPCLTSSKTALHRVKG